MERGKLFLFSSFFYTERFINTVVVVINEMKKGNSKRLVATFDKDNRVGKELAEDIGKQGIYVYDDEETCGICGKKGSYKLMGDSNSNVSFCFAHLQKVDWVKEIMVNRNYTDEQLREILAEFDENEKAGLKMGMFPKDKVKDRNLSKKDHARLMEMNPKGHY